MDSQAVPVVFLGQTLQWGCLVTGALVYALGFANPARSIMGAHSGNTVSVAKRPVEL